MSPFMGMDAVKSHFSRTRASHALSLVADDQADGAGKVAPVHHFAVHGGTDEPETFFFQILNGGRQIGHLGHRGIIQGTGRGTGHRCRQADRPALGNDDPVGTRPDWRYG